MTAEAPFAFVQCDASGCNQTVGLKTCGSCKCYAFCSKECQALFWKAGGHKKVCKTLKALRESGTSVADIRRGIPNDGDICNKATPQISKCKCVMGCNCEMKVGELAALYRQLDGERFFTGMVSKCGVESLDLSEVRKLHYAGGELNGEYHIMDIGEQMTEFAHYDDASESLKSELTQVGLVRLGSPQVCPFHPKAPLSKTDKLLYDKCEMSGLIDFSHKPPGIMLDQKFDVRYPFPDGLRPVGGRIKIENDETSPYRWANFDVRARDDVKVMIAGTFQPGNSYGPEAVGMGFTECMMVDVVSITSFGMIAGIPRVPVEAAMSYLANKEKAKMISFPITCVIGVRHYKKKDGGYW